jgi:hypothetical protein
VTPLARDARRVLFDASPLVHLGQAGLLIPVAGYLGARAAVVRDVHNELVRNRDRFPDLRALSMLRWPPGEPLDLPPDLVADVEGIRRLHTEPGAHPDKNRGEVATALLAGRLGDALAVMDDYLGKRLCQMRAVPRLSTALLVAEIVAAGAVGEPEGAKAFEQCTPSGVGREEFDRAVERATAALGGS